MEINLKPTAYTTVPHCSRIWKCKYIYLFNNETIKRIMCAFRASCYGTCLSWALVMTCVSPFVQDKKFGFVLGGRKEGNILFNDALNTFYLQLYGIRHMVKDHSDSERGNPLPPHRLLFPISSKGSFICIIPQTG